MTEFSHRCHEATQIVSRSNMKARSLLLSAMLLSFSGCQTVPPLPAINLQEPGWSVREGQAVWRLKRGAREIAGEVLLATRLDGRVFIQFTKNPFPIVIAQSTATCWEIQIPIQKKRYSGRGQPPARLPWLYLPRMLAGEPPPKNWTWQKLENNGWRFENLVTGESLEGFFSQ